jgi:hypothetical protein
MRCESLTARMAENKTWWSAPKTEYIPRDSTRQSAGSCGLLLQATAEAAALLEQQIPFYARCRPVPRLRDGKEKARDSVRHDTRLFASRSVRFGMVQGHVERHPYVGTGASERARARGHGLDLVLSFWLGAVFWGVQKFRDAQAAGGADTFVPGNAVVGDTAGNSIYFLFEATFRLSARLILALHFLLPLLECCRHYDLLKG